ncbi:uncharacterized protein EV420DRAFT_1571395 [Desarmillaria tabescens]|uniref:Peptidase C14 caspase domain-containing protein n=1 Tax=Armillaria tabescens TaxID=1929756 RepID=A0AA39JNK2_ARMTA|nr:uncharacterized protein EV420DRAFT_1571395 [Desarmillaria tabescens]KAK0446032.1 hypothetical protein EV420DRAFT_1571395 [Desarmillaria tabescens]
MHPGRQATDSRDSNPQDTDARAVSQETSDENWRTPAKPKERDGPQFRAVIIGIDAYPDYPLYGCVSDAELMEKYLIEDLGVPSGHIQRLLGPTGEKTIDNSISPTRANIIRTLYSLIDSPDIVNGDNIIVYFAGDGALYDAEEYYRNKVPPGVSVASIRPIKALCPMDRGSLDDTGSEILDICDREIDAIFNQISEEKGHKLTLILDCAYSRPRIRYASPLGTRRSQRNKAPLPPHTIEPMLEGAHQRLSVFPQYHARHSVVAYDWQPDMSSHVVLAACQEYHYAREEEDDEGVIHGVCTKLLVDALRSRHSRKSTYVGLMSRLPTMPFVIGDHKDEAIWYQE